VQNGTGRVLPLGGLGQARMRKRLPVRSLDTKDLGHTIPTRANATPPADWRWSRGVRLPLSWCPQGALRLGTGLVALALAYVLAAQLGYRFALVGGNASPLWPAAGIAVAALVLAGRRLWPGILAGALAANLLHGTPALPALLVAGAATAEALLAATLLGRLAFRPALDRLVDVAQLLVAGAALPAAAGALLGIGALATTGTLARQALPLAVVAWWAGDALGILVVGGCCLAWGTPEAERATPIRRLEAGLAIGAVAAASVLCFFDLLDLRAAGEAVAFPIIPLLVWVALRVGPRGTALASVLFAGIAIAATVQGVGPFVGTTRAASLLYVTVFIGLTGITGAAVAAVIAEREAGRRALAQAGAEASGALRQLQAIEAIGRTLAQRGAVPEALDAAMGLLEEAFGYPYSDIYTGDPSGVRLGAQRGFAGRAPARITTEGVIGRVLRTRAPVYLPDVSADPDYLRTNPAIHSEIAAPLLAHGELLGVLNVESGEPLGERDLASVLVVADRVAAALALATERAALAARAAVFGRLLSFTAALRGVLLADELYPTIVRLLRDVVPADLVGLVVLDHRSGDFVVRAEEGSAGSVGRVIRPGEGLSGRAIRERTLVQVADYGSEAFPPAVVGHNAARLYAWALGLPLLRDGEPIGALALARVERDQPFEALELEALELLANQVTLAVRAAWLHAEVVELAIRDGLTGLHNRRYFDEAFAQLLAARARLPAPERAPLAAIMFDLDRFGAFNNRYGHLAGDQVLRTVGALLAGRFRRSDLHARYGGEEFVAVLPGATRSAACAIAEEVRGALAASPIELGTGERVAVTVSAGCAVAEGPEAQAETLIGTADVGLIMAKRAGRNRVVAA
jgi:diguanylate cyclase (GGDEF)-like protein